MSLSLLSRFRSSTSSITSRIAYNAFTLYLFSASDIKTTLIPVSFFSLGAAPLSRTNRISHAIQAIFWIYIHLLQFNLANQVRDPEEDLRNKPWRPLPSGRVTFTNALILRYLVSMLCMTISACYSTRVFYASAFFAILIPMYHELHGDQHWLSKNLMNAVGYACFAIGSTLIASNNRSKLDFTGSFSVFIISAILATTIQAQDFQDVPGDKLVGRNTLPIAFPNIARHTPLITLLFWSAYLSFIWEIDYSARAGFTFLAVVVGLRYYLWRSTKADRLSYFLYNIWLAIAFSLPGYWRMYKEFATR